MNRFKFSLDGVLRFKQQRERMAEIREMRASAAVESARKRIEEVEGQLARLAGEMSAGVPSGSWPARFDHSVRLGESLREAIKAHQVATQVHQDAAHQRTRAAQEVAALKTVREQRLAEFRLEFQRKEQNRLDEVGMRDWEPPDWKRTT